MSQIADVERRVGHWLLSDVPAEAPTELVPEALARIASIPQDRVGWPCLAGRTRPERTLRLVLVAALLLLGLAIAAALGTPRRPTIDPDRANLPQGAMPVSACELVRGELLNGLVPGIWTEDHGTMTTVGPIRSVCQLFAGPANSDGDRPWIGNMHVAHDRFGPDFHDEASLDIRGVPVVLSTCSVALPSRSDPGCAAFDVDGGAWHYTFVIDRASALADVDLLARLEALAAQVIERAKQGTPQVAVLPGGADPVDPCRLLDLRRLAVLVPDAGPGAGVPVDGTSVACTIVTTDVAGHEVVVGRLTATGDPTTDPVHHLLITDFEVRGVPVSMGECRDVGSGWSAEETPQCDAAFVVDAGRWNYLFQIPDQANLRDTGRQLLLYNLAADIIAALEEAAAK